MVLKDGKGLMPKFPTLSKDEKDAVIAFLWDEGKEKQIDTDEIKMSFSKQIPNSPKLKCNQIYFSASYNMRDENP